MTQSDRVRIRRIATKVPGLDEILGGGIPEYSFNVISGPPGGGKTTLAQQFLFGVATPECPAIYFTILGESPLKMLRYQQQFSFFDPDKLGGAVRFVNLSQEVMGEGLEAVLETMVSEVQSTRPGLVVVDSFRSIARGMTDAGAGQMGYEEFIHRLSLQLTSWQATTFLVGEYSDSEIRVNPVFTVADGILSLEQIVERSSVVRKIRVLKIRGQEHQPGLHTFRITSDGVQVFPRSFGLTERSRRPKTRIRLSTGVAGLDEMLGGGIPAGDSVLVAGPAGSGKTALCTEFIAAGIERGEPGVIVIFEEHRSDYTARADSLGFDMEAAIEDGKLIVLYLRSLDLSVDETLRDVHDAVEKIGAQRVVLDSLSGFEIALAPDFREDFRESLYRLVGSLTGIGVTMMNSVEVVDAYTELRFSPHTISFLTDDVILQRYVEIDGQLQRILVVVKMRNSNHSKELRTYDITSHGIVVGSRLAGYQGILSGVPRLQPAVSETTNS